MIVKSVDVHVVDAKVVVVVVAAVVAVAVAVAVAVVAVAVELKNVGTFVDHDILVVVVVVDTSVGVETSAVYKQHLLVALALLVVGMFGCLDVEIVACVLGVHGPYLDVL